MRHGKHTFGTAALLCAVAALLPCAAARCQVSGKDSCKMHTLYQSELALLGAMLILR
jgi:hypothetical protein